MRFLAGNFTFLRIYARTVEFTKIKIPSPAAELLGGFFEYFSVENLIALESYTQKTEKYRGVENGGEWRSLSEKSSFSDFKRAH